MASAFGHAVAAIGLGSVFQKHVRTPKFWVLGIVCSIIPDADVIGFQYEIPYESFGGHRGFSHSILFAGLFGIFIAYLFYKSQRPLLSLYFFICVLSHGILDGMTSGGRGVAYFSPFENSRHFLPWRPIKVSPIEAKNFFSEWGLQVLESEAIWIGIPVLVFTSIIYILKSTFLSK